MRRNYHRSKMSSFDFGSALNWLNVIAALAAAVTVIVAIWGIRLQKEVAAAQVKPLLNIEGLTSLDFKDEKEDSAEVRLVNEGNGTAVITSVCFQRNDRSGLNLTDVLDNLDEAKGKGLQFKGQHFGERLNYLRSKQRVTLLFVSVKRVRPKPGARELFDAIGKQIEQTKITVKFEDVFGNKQPTFEENFDDPTIDPTET